MGVDLHESTRIDLDTRRRQIQALGVGHPPHRHHHDRSLSTVSCAVLREIHPNATRRRIKRLHTTEALAHHHARFAEGGRDRRGHVVVLAGQDPRAALEQLHFRAEGVEDRGDLRPGRPPADDQHRLRDRCQGPGIAVGGGQLEPGDLRPPARAAAAQDEPAA